MSVRTSVTPSSIFFRSPIVESVVEPTVTVRRRYSVLAPSPIQDGIEHAEHAIDPAVLCRTSSPTPPSRGSTEVTNASTPEPSAVVSLCLR